MKTRNSVASTGTTRITRLCQVAGHPRRAHTCRDICWREGWNWTPALLAVITSGTQFMG